MSGKGVKGLIMGKANKDKEKKKPISRSSRTGLQMYRGLMILLICVGTFIPTLLPPQSPLKKPFPTTRRIYYPPAPRRPLPPRLPRRPLPPRLPRRSLP